MGHVAFYMGEFRLCEEFNSAAAMSASLPPALRGYALVRRGNALWFLGFPDQALALTKEGSRLVEDADDPYQYCLMLLYAVVTHLLCRKLAEAEDLCRKALNTSTERGFPVVGATTTLFMGLVTVERGQALAGLEQLHRGIELRSASPAFGQQPEPHGFWLAEGLASVGRLDEAFAALVPDLQRMEQSGVEQDLAHMYELRGRLFVGKSNPNEAENSFRTAIEIARRQSAKSLELNATTSLARFLAEQGRRDEARAMLAEIYNWFTEGFDTADLKEAKALLEELSN